MYNAITHLEYKGYVCKIKGYPGKWLVGLKIGNLQYRVDAPDIISLNENFKETVNIGLTKAANPYR